MTGALEPVGVLGKGILLTGEGSCDWSCLYLSDRSLLGLGIRDPAATRPGDNWDGTDLRKGHRGQDPGRGPVLLACRSLNPFWFVWLESP